MRDNKRGTIEDRSVDALLSTVEQCAVEGEWDYAAKAALTVFADGLEETLLEGKKLSTEDIIAAAREIAGKLGG